MERKKNEGDWIINSLRRPEIHVMKVSFKRTRSFSFLKTTTCTPAQGGFTPPASETRGQTRRTDNAARSVTATFSCGIMINQLEPAALDDSLIVCWMRGFEGDGHFSLLLCLPGGFMLCKAPGQFHYKGHYIKKIKWIMSCSSVLSLNRVISNPFFCSVMPLSSDSTFRRWFFGRGLWNPTMCLQ